MFIHELHQEGFVDKRFELLVNKGIDLMLVDAFAQVILCVGILLDKKFGM